MNPDEINVQSINPTEENLERLLQSEDWRDRMIAAQLGYKPEILIEDPFDAVREAAKKAMEERRNRQ